jgi:hypothetical protein
MYTFRRRLLFPGKGFLSFNLRGHVFSERYKLNILLLFRWISIFRALPWLWRRRPGLDIRPDHVRFVVDKVALEKVFLRVLRVSLVGTISPMSHTDLLHVVLTVRTNGRSLETSQTAMLFRKSWSFGERSNSNFFQSSWSSSPVQTKQRQFS